MPDFGIFRGFNEKLFGDKLVAGQLPTELGLIGSLDLNLLLDSYPNAAAAYSLRKLRAAYTGGAIEVRNDSGTHLDIGFVDNKLDTATLLTHCGSGNGTVSKWYDQSGNARNATQTTVANQPQIVSSGSVITENGEPALQFDGSNDTFDRITTTVSLRSFYFVGQVSANDENPFIAWGSLGGVGTLTSSVLGFGNISSLLTNESISFFNGDTQSIFTDNYTVTNYTTTSQEQIILSSYFNTGANGKIFINNNNANLIANNYEIKTLDYQIGKRINVSQYYNMKMQEIVMYSTEESSNNSGINTKINDFYSIY